MSNRKKTKNVAPPAAAGANKKEKVLALLRRDGGATLDEVVDASGWLPHSARAVFTGLRKKGFAIDRQKVDGTTRYCLTKEPVA